MNMLTERDLAIVRELAAGRTNKEIGRALGKTAGTVRVQLTAIYEKADVCGRKELADLAWREGWVR